MRIIIAAEPMENGGGLATFTLDTTAELAQARADWQFTLLALSWFDTADRLTKYPNVKVVFCDRLGLRGTLSRMLPAFRGRERLFDALAKILPLAALRKQFGNLTEIWKGLGPYDAVWVPHFAVSQNRWPALYSPEIIRSPVLLSIHDLHAAVFPGEWEKYPQMLNNFWNDFRGFAGRAQAIITHSEFQKRSIQEHFGLPAGRITVAYIPLPLDQDLVAEYPGTETEGTLLKYGISRPYVFCPLSQGMGHKNHLRTIEAWAILSRRLKDDCPMLVFTARGTEEQYAIFKNAVTANRLEKLVMFTGTISRRELAILYQQCRAVLSPTLYEGGGSGPVIEGTLVGKPVASSNIPVVIEYNNQVSIDAVNFDPNNPVAIADATQQTLLMPGRRPQKAFEEIKRLDSGRRAQFVSKYIQELDRIAQSEIVKTKQFQTV